MRRFVATCLAALFVLAFVARPSSAQTMGQGIPYDVDWDHDPGPQILFKDGDIMSPLRSLDVRLTSLILAAFEAKMRVEVTYKTMGQYDVLTSATFYRNYPTNPPQDSYWVTKIHVELTSGKTKCTASFQDSTGMKKDATVDNTQKQSILESSIRAKDQPVQYVDIDQNGNLTRCKVNAG